MSNEKNTCNQICRWNDPSDGCIRPARAICPLSNTKPDASGWGQAKGKEKRLIDANALLEKYWQRVYDGEIVTLQDVRYAIENAPTVGAVEVAQRWIPVEDRLPARDGQYLCNYHFGSHCNMTFTRVLDYYATDEVPHFQHTLGDKTMKVTHWMPLPEPPKAGD